jgi:putative ABC transport system substrate-binding protein
LPWQGQSPAAKVYRIGYLATAPSTEEFESLRQGLSDYGYVEGQNLIIDRRYSEGHTERFPDLAAELVAVPVELIIAVGTPAFLAANHATRTIPIVFIAIGDPVGSGFVASLSHPGGNATGLSLLSAPLTGKRLELLQQAVSGGDRVAVLWNPANPSNASGWTRIQSQGQELGLQLQSLRAQEPADFESAFESTTRAHADALLVGEDSLPLLYRTQLVDLAAKSRLPVMYPSRSFVEVGGLMAYGPRRPDMYRRAATYVEKILRGAKPADLPIEQPMLFDFVVNLKTARELGITFPNEILLQVTEVIQ